MRLLLLAPLALLIGCDSPTAPELSAPHVLRHVLQADEGPAVAQRLAGTPDFNACFLEFEEPVAGGLVAYGFRCELRPDREAPDWVWLRIHGPLATGLPLADRLLDGWTDCQVDERIGAPGNETLTTYRCTRP